jgi:uncharacterized protein (DUF488 family)
MHSSDFLKGVVKLIHLEGEARTEGGKVAIMCAEALPWRCHRMLVSDQLTANGFRVEHIIAREKLIRHKMTPFAQFGKPRNGVIPVSYPAPKYSDLDQSSARQFN